jgi:geranylgeranyl pyrophosphate synthase
MQFEQSAHIEPEQYEMMIDLKTGALIRLACELGGIIGDGQKEQVEALSRFGLLLGRAFQMQDDLLEVTSSADKMGKSLGSDVLNEKKTWIWLDLKKNLSSAEVDQWKEIQTSGQMNSNDREIVHTWMIKYGTIARAKALVQGWILEADGILNGSSFTNTKMLKSLADIILKRQN